MENAAFTWGFKAMEDKQMVNDQELPNVVSTGTPLISHLNLDLKYNDTVVVIGKTGSGKSTLFSSILRETQLVEGDLKVKGRIAYAAQQPFIQHGTMLQNILFGQPFNQSKLDHILKISFKTMLKSRPV